MKYRRVNLDDDAREVLTAIYRGKHTFNDIRRATKCTAERVSEALALLLLAVGAIRTERRAGVRHYVPAIATPPKSRKHDSQDQPPLALSFSTLPGLMPLRPTVRVTEESGVVYESSDAYGESARNKSTDFRGGLSV